MKILLVEDDGRTASFIVKGLNQADYVVDHVTEGSAGLLRAEMEPYDAAVIDIMLPKLDGLTLIDRMRKKRITTPVLVLSAKKTVDDRVKGLQAGGDDYLVKPFAFSELLARIQALLRRAQGALTDLPHLSVGDLTMDLTRRKVHRSGLQIDLQQREFALLEYLMRNHGRAVSKTMIMEHVWDYNFDPQTNVVEACICRLREKIDRSFDRKLIQTVRGIGYVLEEKS